MSGTTFWAHMFQKDKHLGALLLSILAWNLSCSVLPSCHSWCSNLQRSEVRGRPPGQQNRAAAASDSAQVRQTPPPQ